MVILRSPANKLSLKDFIPPSGMTFSSSNIKAYHLKGWFVVWPNSNPHKQEKGGK
jgi:hypothetical protein